MRYANKEPYTSLPFGYDWMKRRWDPLQCWREQSIVYTWSISWIKKKHSQSPEYFEWFRRKIFQYSLERFQDMQVQDSIKNKSVRSLAMFTRFSAVHNRRWVTVKGTWNKTCLLCQIFRRTISIFRMYTFKTVMLIFVREVRIKDPNIWARVEYQMTQQCRPKLEWVKFKHSRNYGKKQRKNKKHQSLERIVGARSN